MAAGARSTRKVQISARTYTYRGSATVVEREVLVAHRRQRARRREDRGAVGGRARQQPFEDERRRLHLRAVKLGLLLEAIGVAASRRPSGVGLGILDPARAPRSPRCAASARRASRSPRALDSRRRRRRSPLGPRRRGGRGDTSRSCQSAAWPSSDHARRRRPESECMRSGRHWAYSRPQCSPIGFIFWSMILRPSKSSAWI